MTKKGLLEAKKSKNSNQYVLNSKKSKKYSTFVEFISNMFETAGSPGHGLL